MDNSMRDEEDARKLLLIQLASSISLINIIWGAILHRLKILHYRALSEHPSLPLDVQESQHMMIIALIVFLSWGVLSALAKFAFHKTWCRFIAVVDLAVVGLIITALVNRAQYFPTTIPRCAHSDASEPIGKFFAYVALVANGNNENDKGDDYTPDMACQSFLAESVYTIMISYMWTILSILGTLNQSWNVTGNLLLLFFFPLPLFLGIYMRSFVAAYILFVCLSWLYLYIWPPIPWPLWWYLSWPLRIVWSTLVGIVPSIRYMARARLKRIIIEKSCSGSLDLEKGRYASSSGSVLHVAETYKTWIEPHPDSSNLSLAAGPLTQQPMQAGDTEPLKETLSKVGLKARICGHSNDWYCWACGFQACSQCSIEISGLPQTTQHFYCEPRCSRCYLNTMCGILPAKKSKPCSHRQDRCKTLQIPRVCRSCSENCSGDKLLRRLEEREREELIHLARHNLKCGVCENRLQPKGPRWWTCCDCNEECNSDYHPSWSKIPE